MCVQKTTEISQLQYTDDVVDVPVVLVVQVLDEQVVTKTAEIAQWPFVKKIGVIPETAEIPQLPSDVQVRTVQGTHTSESFIVAGKFHREILMRGRCAEYGSRLLHWTI